MINGQFSAFPSRQIYNDGWKAETSNSYNEAYTVDQQAA